MSTALPLPSAALASSSSHVLISTGSSLHAIALAAGSSSSTAAASEGQNQPHVASLIRQIASSPDGSHVATVSDDKVLRVYSIEPLQLLSSRPLSKRASHISFAGPTDILVTDKVGDVYRYPLEPRTSAKPRPTATELASDPSKNPDADLMLGHVSLITQHLITPDGKRIITADRDEHIRISRYPRADVVDKFLFGSNGFISALHIPQSRPDVLITAGGENSMRFWDWRNGKSLGSLGIWEAVLPYRKVRSTMRRTRKPKKAPAEEYGGEEGFYAAPEGWMLPSGQGVCVKKIDSVQTGAETVVVFYSEGASAVHAFTLPSDFASSPQITTLDLSHPILDFTSLPSGQILVSLDTAFGVLKHNQTGENKKRSDPTEAEVQQVASSTASALVQVTEGASLSSTTSDLLASVQTLTAQSTAPAKLLANLDLYPDLPLLPRWPGFEEDEDLAGPSELQEDEAAAAAGSSGSPKPTSASRVAPSEAGTAGFALKRDYTRDELEAMGPRALGRLKALGVDVGNLTSRKKLKRDARLKREAEGMVEATGKKGGKKFEPRKGMQPAQNGEAAAVVEEVDEESAMNE